MSEENGLSLAREIAEIFYNVFNKIVIREQADKKYMNQTILGVRFRAFIAVLEAFRLSFLEIYRFLALCIANHRQVNHGENKAKTIEKLSRSMTSEMVTKATKAYWNL